ncbi:hypothetical protein B0A55_03204 [Friedmanniomyces simplex]|uniref:Uncharacterized protein n=1 Tax=Friedmanniomyces simplex TaxID=329884 RepID=A0A4U0XMS7_9PEZI|nr:hypothetical protein B0A55_03204 [Friedmanniomyces simplex]
MSLLRACGVTATILASMSSLTEKTLFVARGTRAPLISTTWKVAVAKPSNQTCKFAGGEKAVAQEQNEDIHDNGASLTSQDQRHANAFQLHPEEHTFRQPTTITRNWTISTGVRRLDGVLKRVYLVNDAFPGPTVELRSGDRLVIHVNNALTNDEGVSIHWHGLSMRGANNQDGAAGITQNAIPPGETLTYNFTIADDQHGTFWWHAHSAVQRADGLFGGLVVHQPAEFGQGLPAIEQEVEYLLMVQDWYHRSAEEALDFYMHLGSFGNEPVPDSILLNGAGRFNCSNTVPARPVDCEAHTRNAAPGLRLDRSKKSLLRLVNVGAYAGMGFLLGGTRLRPIAVDGGNAVDVESAYSVGFLYPGERVDLEVEPLAGAQTEESYLELELDTARFKYSNPALASTQRMPVRWHGARQSAHSADEQPESHLDLQKLKAHEDGSKFMPVAANMTIVLYAITQKLAHLKNVPHGSINNTYWQPQSSPPGPLINLERTQWDKHQFVPHIPYVLDSPLWVDIVLNNLDEEGHPFHLHGYDFWVLASHSSTFNWGSYNPFEDAEPPGGAYNLVNAVKKDTVLVPRRGYAVLRLRADSPGLWVFHCHVIWHLASGMAMAFEVA